MLNLKKGLALVLAAATAFTFAPVANLGSAVTANAAAVDGGSVEIDGTNASKKTKVVNDVNTGSAYTYKLVADNKDAWDVVNVSLTGGSNSGTISQSGTSVDSTNFTLTSTSVGLVFQDKGTGKHGPYTFTLTNANEQGKTGSEAEIAKWKVSLKNNKNASITDGAISSIRVIDSNGTVTGSDTKTTEKVGTDSYYKLAYGNTYNVTITQPTVSGVSLTTDNTSLGFSYDGVAYVQASADNNSLASATIKTTGAGRTKVTAYWTAKEDLGSVVKKGATFGSTTFTVQVDNAAGDIKVAYKGIDGSEEKDIELTAADAGTTTKYIQLDTLINTSKKINVTSSVTPTFVSQNPSKVTVAADGTLHAVAAGSTNVVVYVGDKSFTIPVYVSDQATDNLTIKVNGNEVNDSDKPVDLDLQTSTATTAVKSAKLDVTSAGNLAYSIYLVDGYRSTTAVAGSKNDIVTVSTDGTITAGSKAGTAYVYVVSTAAGKIAKDEKWVKVVVNSLPAADLKVNDVRLDLKNNKTADVAYTTNVTNPVVSYFVDATPKTAENANVVSLFGKTLTAKSYGVATLRVVEAATTTTRQTTATAKIYVLQDATKSDSDLKVASSALTLAVGKTVSAGASTSASGAAITYASDNEKVATVAADGTIKAVAPGTAVVTVKAAETDTVNAGVATIVVTVPQNPAKVAGLKVANKKGAKVSVSWKSQGGSISYRVYKKVGNGKWVAKNVTSNKATLSVKKGAKVQVKVKAFVKDSTGKTTWGPKATKVTKTTDKK